MATEVAIVGAGLAGPLAALLLAHNGWRVTVIERRDDPRTAGFSGGRSINLALAARGLKALAAGGVEKEVDPLLIPMRGRMTHSRSGETSLLPYGQRPGEVIHSVSREGLNRLLVDAAERTGRVTFLFGHRLEDYDPERKTLSLVDGANHPGTFQADIVIGADGAGSALRQALAERGLIRADEDILDHGYKELSIAPGAHGAHRMEREALHIWPRGGYMLIALPNLDGSFTVTLFLGREGEPGFAQLDRAEAVQTFFENEFADAAALMPRLTDDFLANPTGALGTVYSQPWQVEGKVLLIGDAAHAIVPFHGQGMNAAFEDCRLLAERLEPGCDVEQVFAQFSRDHKPDGDAIAKMALENYIEMRDTVRDPGFALRKELGFELERRLPDRFVPRYSMVMFHHLPYAEVLRRGAIQHELLMRLTRDKNKLEEIDLDAAAEAARQALPSMRKGSMHR
ncbi:MAG: FAD-dependent monooxygenase [Gammaproteobacteria bacterium]|nr:FAD-dependent monooxygenase [Gammaproteobacteria bacterium]